MLCLKRLVYFNEYIKDTVDGRIIQPGEYYYEDFDENWKSTGLIISLEHYYELKKEQEEEAWENSDAEKWYNAMENDREYREALKEAEMSLREAKVLKLIRYEDKL